MKKVSIEEGPKISDYEAYASLYPTVRDFVKEVEMEISRLRKHKIWLINSTAQGGGVAEMLPPIIRLCREFNLDIDWRVIETDKPEFFQFTKKLHNLIHGTGDPNISETEKELYEQVNATNCKDFIDEVKDGDIIVVHDPQPMPIVSFIKKYKKVKALWRSHIGLDKTNKATKAAWGFLQKYFQYYDHFVFSAPEYIPEHISGKVSIIPPGIDPLSFKNMELRIHKVSGILRCSNLVPDHHPFIYPPFEHKAKRLLPDGSFGSPFLPDDPGLLFRPIVTQISRWDKLKGFKYLFKAFIKLKKNITHYAKNDEIHKKRLLSVRLVMAGPDPEFVEDDPEAESVIKELKREFMKLSPEIARDIVMLILPMNSVKENALIVNSLQRCSTLVVQNSLREGFGLTATEAMWKSKPIMASNACGLRHQIRNGIDGCLVNEPGNPEEVAYVMNDMLANAGEREVWANNAQRRVIENFLVFSQLKKWMQTMLSFC